MVWKEKSMCDFSLNLSTLVARPGHNSELRFCSRHDNLISLEWSLQVVLRILFINNISVVMVTGGSDLASVELLSTNGTRLCALPSLPDLRVWHTQSGLVTCGGEGNQPPSCLTFSGGHWKKTHTLRPRYGRYGHTAWASPQGVLLMGGDSDYPNPSLTTTELLNDDGSTTASFNLDNQRR